jgi:hypothetical protein
LYHISVLHTFFLLNSIPLYGYCILLTHLSIVRHLVSLCFLAIVNNAVFMCKFLYKYVFICTGYVPKSRLAELYGTSMVSIQGTAKWFPKQVHFTFPPAEMGVPLPVEEVRAPSHLLLM